MTWPCWPPACECPEFMLCLWALTLICLLGELLFSLHRLLASTSLSSFTLHLQCHFLERLSLIISI